MMPDVLTFSLKILLTYVASLPFCFFVVVLLLLSLATPLSQKTLWYYTLRYTPTTQTI